MRELQPHVLKPYLSREKISLRIEQLALELSQEYTGVEDNTVLLCVLKGAFVFAADLVRVLPLNIPIEFCRARSYGNEMESSGDVSCQLPPKERLAGMYVILVEDIVDTGETLVKLQQELEKMAVKRVEVCTLLSKPSCRKVKAKPRYVGFEVPDLFFVGYGLDYAEYYRNLDYLATVSLQDKTQKPI